MAYLVDSDRNIEDAEGSDAKTGVFQEARSKTFVTASSVASAAGKSSAAMSAAGSSSGRYSGLGFWAYLFVNVVITVGFSMLAAWLWSDMGDGPDSLATLRKYMRHKWKALGAMAALFVLLYVLDFFCPPHIPGQRMVFYRKDRFFRWVAIVLMAVGVIASILLQAGDYPTVPLAVTIFMCPPVVLVFRHVTRPKKRYAKSHSGLLQDLQGRVTALGQLAAREEDQKAFYTSASIAFALAGLAVVAPWIRWMVIGVDHDGAKRRGQDKELLFIRDGAPFIVFVSNVVFASFMALRVHLNSAYSATDKRRTQLIIGENPRSKKAFMNHRIQELHARLAQAAAAEHPDEMLKATRDTHQEYLIAHKRKMSQLSALVKTLSTAFVAVLGSLYIVFQLTLADSHVAFLVQGFVAGYFAVFVTLICVSCRRLFRVMRTSLAELALWKSAAAASQSDWAKAFAATLLLPAFVVLVALSFANQAVRRCRGLTDGSRWMTAKVADMLDKVRAWNRLPVAMWTYVFATLVICYKLAPTFVNVLLARMSMAMEGLNFFLLCAATFGLGMFLFMLPPVPGPPIYLFGGYVISPACEWGGPEAGFWIGALVCVVLCFVLKLAACAVQQKLIGERLGSRQWVQEMCGVHKPFIRAIESVLRRPGLSFGKCMILCGGPDWPTSVLAGILRLSLRQMLLGTLPIVANVVPLTLTGSFLVKRNEGEVWNRLARLMFTITALVSVVFWAGMAWAIQDEFERNHHELVRPKEEYLELDWADYRRDYTRKKCDVTLVDLPRWLQAVYFGGALVLTAVSNLFLWRSSKCFGEFSVTEDVSDLRWIGRDGLIRFWGLVGLSAAAVSYLGYVSYKCWLGRRNAALTAAAAAELLELEADWKATRLREARAAASRGPAPPPRAPTALRGVSSATEVTDRMWSSELSATRSDLCTTPAPPTLLTCSPEAKPGKQAEHDVIAV